MVMNETSTVKRVSKNLKPSYPPQPESVSDFRYRIKLMMRERETGIKLSVVGAASSNPCVVRKPMITSDEDTIINFS